MEFLTKLASDFFRFDTELTIQNREYKKVLNVNLNLPSVFTLIASIKN